LLITYYYFFLNASIISLSTVESYYQMLGKTMKQLKYDIKELNLTEVDKEKTRSTRETLINGKEIDELFPEAEDRWSFYIENTAFFYFTKPLRVFRNYSDPRFLFEFKGDILVKINIICSSTMFEKILDEINYQKEWNEFSSDNDNSHFQKIWIRNQENFLSITCWDKGTNEGKMRLALYPKDEYIENLP